MQDGETPVSNKPRNPRYFPKMKVRGARRRQIAPWQRMAGGIDRMGYAFHEVAHTFADFLKALEATKTDAPGINNQRPALNHVGNLTEGAN
jgi:hypothetical protein